MAFSDPNMSWKAINLICNRVLFRSFSARTVAIECGIADDLTGIAKGTSEQFSFLRPMKDAEENLRTVLLVCTGTAKCNNTFFCFCVESEKTAKVFICASTDSKAAINAFCDATATPTPSSETAIFQLEPFPIRFENATRLYSHCAILA
jgi:hypothetical protein